MSEVFFVGDAAPEFKEGEHPRDSDGKFSKGGGGGASAHSFAPYISNYNLEDTIKHHGFKSLGKVNGMPTFQHPSGVKVVVHPSPGQKSSSKWAFHFNGETNASEGGEKGKNLDKLLKGVLGTPSFEAKKKETPEELKAKSEAMYTAKPGIAVPPAAVSPEAQAASIWNNLPAEAAKEKAQATVGESYQDTSSLLTAQKGYIFSHTAPDKLSYIYKKSDGSKAEVFVDNSWIAQTPGHMTKEGKGTENLEKLLSGKPAVVAPGQPTPWQNSGKTIPGSPEDLAQQTAAQKAEAEIAAVKQEKQNAALTLYNKLKAQAAVPTSAQASAISYYSASGYKSLNHKLRSDPDFAKTNDTVKELDAYLNNCTISEDIVVKRGVNAEYAQVLKSIMFEGSKFIERGFMSTSVSQGFGGELQMVINIPKGSKGAALGSNSDHPNEMEVLLPRNSVFAVKAYNPKSGHVELELVGIHNA